MHVAKCCLFYMDNQRLNCSDGYNYPQGHDQDQSPRHATCAHVVPCNQYSLHTLVFFLDVLVNHRSEKHNTNTSGDYIENKSCAYTRDRAGWVLHIEGRGNS